MKKCNTDSSRGIKTGEINKTQETKNYTTIAIKAAFFTFGFWGLSFFFVIYGIYR